MFSTRLGEHKIEAEKVGETTFTRSQRLASTTDTSYKSAIAEHVATNNHVIGWGRPKLLIKRQTRQHAGSRKLSGSAAEETTP